jgi:NAD(P)-dependent dehydrogenase (short-subunit alcohol dehydrogenase family)
VTIGLGRQPGPRLGRGAEPALAAGQSPEALMAPGRSAELAGTVAVVTGAGRGIGKILARALAGAGVAVGLIARSGDELDRTQRLITPTGGIAAAASADVSEHSAAEWAIGELRRQLGPVDLLVNNAGTGGPVGDAWDVDPDDWWHTIEINLRGVFLCSRAVLPAMTARGAGRIINITSQAGVYRWPQVSAYSVSKAAVIKFTENLGAEASRSGVRAFSVHPGLTPIGLSERALASTAPPGSAEARMHAWVRQELRSGHGAEPALVERLVTRLATGDADRLSGCHLSVHDDLDAILACGEGVRDRYQLRRAGTPKRWAEPRHRDVAPAVRRARPQAEQGTVPDKQK